VKIVCIGGGPAGLYFAISAKRRDPAHEVTVMERSGEGATYGWGVVYWDNLLDMLFTNDFESARAIRAASRLWQDQDIRMGDDVAHLAGYGYSITRARLLEILGKRARDLGVDLRHGEPVDDLDRFAHADVIVCADGAASTMRSAHQAEFGTTLVPGRNRYMWLGTTKMFDRFTFAFQPTAAGWLWFHAYPSAENSSTCIIETTEDTWRAHGFAHRDTADTLAELNKLFHDPLEGHPLIAANRADITLGDPARWERFTEVSNDRWYHRNVALIGDAAHTTHFTIGSGTRLAMIDSMALAQALYEHPADVGAALRTYDERRRPPMHSTQASARASMDWFEHVDAYADRDVVDFAYAMSSRQGEQPPWRYQKHVLNQVGAVLWGRRVVNTARRWQGAARRGEPVLPASLLHAVGVPVRG